MSELKPKYLARLIRGISTVQYNLELDEGGIEM